MNGRQFDPESVEITYDSTITSWWWSASPVHSGAAVGFPDAPAMGWQQGNGQAPQVVSQTEQGTLRPKLTLVREQQVASVSNNNCGTSIPKNDSYLNTQHRTTIKSPVSPSPGTEQHLCHCHWRASAAELSCVPGAPSLRAECGLPPLPPHCPPLKRASPMLCHPLL